MDTLICVTSKGSLELFPENKAGSFVNHMVHPISLSPNNEYEIAVVSAHIPTQFYAVLRNDEGFGIYLYVTFQGRKGEKDKEFELEYTPYINILAGNMYILTDSLNNDFLRKLKVYFESYNISDYLHEGGKIFSYNGNDTHINVKYNQSTKPVKVGEIKSIAIRLKPKLGKVLGFPGTYTYEVYKQIKDYTVDSILSPNHILPMNGVDYMYLYSDIVQPIEFGGKLVNMLDCVSVGDHSYKGFHNAIYRSINTNYINNIAIKITDCEGRAINFVPGTATTCILHLRSKPSKGIYNL